MYAGYAAQPAGSVNFSYLQGGGTSFDVTWSNIRDFETTFTTAATLPSWTNPTTCVAPASQCGNLGLAIPVSGAPGVPEAWILNGGAEMAIDGSTWHSQHGELTLHGEQFFVILTDAGNIPADAEITFKGKAWDGAGAPHPPLP